MKKLLSIDLSTSSTGFATFYWNGTLLDCGIIKPKKVKGKKDETTYPETQLLRMYSICSQIVDLVDKEVPDVIVIEEIAGSSSRLGQKTLDGIHWILADYLYKNGTIKKIVYYDVTGVSGWRTHLRLVLSDADKLHNKEAKKLNKITRGKKIIPITPKHLACRYVNHFFKMNLDVDLNKSDSDVSDAICIGHSYCKLYLK